MIRRHRRIPRHQNSKSPQPFQNRLFTYIFMGQKVEHGVAQLFADFLLYAVSLSLEVKSIPSMPMANLPEVLLPLIFKTQT